MPLGLQSVSIRNESALVIAIGGTQVPLNPNTFNQPPHLNLGEDKGFFSTMAEEDSAWCLPTPPELQAPHRNQSWVPAGSESKFHKNGCLFIYLLHGGISPLTPKSAFHLPLPVPGGMDETG